MAALPTYLYIDGDRVGRVVDFSVNHDRNIFEVVVRSGALGVSVVSVKRYMWKTTGEEIQLIVLETTGMLG